jgi:Flp pilus assembly protein TadD
MSGQEPAEAMALARQAYESARAGNADDAITKLREAARLAPGNALYRSALGGIYERQGKLVAADREFSAALRLEPSNPTLLLKAASIGTRLKQFEAARGSLIKLLELQPTDASTRELLESVSLDWGAELAESKRFRVGLLLAQDTAKRFPGSPRAHLMLGLFAVRNQQNMAAVDAYLRALELDPNSAAASAGLGIAQSNAGMYTEARRTFEEGIRKFPNDAAQLQAHGVLLVKLAESGAGTEAAALEALESALRLDASLTEPHYQLGNLALARDNPAVALRHFEAAGKSGLDDSRIHWALARALRRLGKAEEAARHIELFHARKKAEQP